MYNRSLRAATPQLRIESRIFWHKEMRRVDLRASMQRRKLGGLGKDCAVRKGSYGDRLGDVAK